MAVLSTVKLGAMAVCANFIGASAYDTSVPLSNAMKIQTKEERVDISGTLKKWADEIPNKNVSKKVPELNPLNAYAASTDVVRSIRHSALEAQAAWEPESEEDRKSEETSRQETSAFLMLLSTNGAMDKKVALLTGTGISMSNRGRHFALTPEKIGGILGALLFLKEPKKDEDLYKSRKKLSILQQQNSIYEAWKSNPEGVRFLLLYLLRKGLESVPRPSVKYEDHLSRYLRGLKASLLLPHDAARQDLVIRLSSCTDKELKQCPKQVKVLNQHVQAIQEMHVLQAVGLPLKGTHKGKCCEAYAERNAMCGLWWKDLSSQKLINKRGLYRSIRDASNQIVELLQKQFPESEKIIKKKQLPKVDEKKHSKGNCALTILCEPRYQEMFYSSKDLASINSFAKEKNWPKWKEGVQNLAKKFNDLKDDDWKGISEVQMMEKPRNDMYEEYIDVLELGNGNLPKVEADTSVGTQDQKFANCVENTLKNMLQLILINARTVKGTANKEFLSGVVPDALRDLLQHDASDGSMPQQIQHRLWNRALQNVLRNEHEHTEKKNLLQVLYNLNSENEQDIQLEKLRGLRLGNVAGIDNIATFVLLFSTVRLAWIRDHMEKLNLEDKGVGLSYSSHKKDFDAIRSIQTEALNGLKDADQAQALGKSFFDTFLKQVKSTFEQQNASPMLKLSEKVEFKTGIFEDCESDQFVFKSSSHQGSITLSLVGTEHAALTKSAPIEEFRRKVDMISEFPSEEWEFARTLPFTGLSDREVTTPILNSGGRLRTVFENLPLAYRIVIGLQHYSSSLFDKTWAGRMRDGLLWAERTGKTWDARIAMIQQSGVTEWQLGTIKALNNRHRLDWVFHQIRIARRGGRGEPDESDSHHSSSSY